MFEDAGFDYLYRAYDEYVRTQEAAGKKPVNFIKFAFGRV